MPPIENDIETLLSPAIEALGLELWGVEFRPSSGNALLRLYIDADGRAITVEDCEAVSREVSARLDVHDPIDSHYTLEVSSPGLDRPLFKPAHFARFIGAIAKIELEFAQDGRRRFQGVIVAATDEAVTIEQDGQPVALVPASIQKARLVPVFKVPAKPTRAGSRGAKRKNQGG